MGQLLMMVEDDVISNALSVTLGYKKKKERTRERKRKEIRKTSTPESAREGKHRQTHKWDSTA